MKKLTDYLQELGLTEIEAVLYHGLLEIGPTTIMELAEHTGIKRITVHFNIKNLIEKGLVAQTIQGSRRQITAESPEKLEYLIEQKENKIKRIRSDFSVIMQNISDNLSYTKTGENIQVRYYEGKKAVQSVYREILTAKKIYAFANFNLIQTIFPENPDLFQKAIEDDPEKQIWDIFEATKETRKHMLETDKRHHFCFFPPNVSFSDFDFLIFDNSVAMIYLHPDKPYVIVSHSSAMAAGLRAIHSIVWRVLSGKSY